MDFGVLYYLTLLGLAILILQQTQLFLHQVLQTSMMVEHRQLVSLQSVSVVNVVSEHFVSVTLGAKLIRHKWKRFNLRSRKMKTLAKGLAPSYVRVGGTDCDFLIFNKTDDKTLRFQSLDVDDDVEYKVEKNFTMTPKDWDKLNTFVQESGWELIFDFNVFLRKDGKWDPANAIELLKYTVQKGYKPAGYELGNEPNSYYHNFNLRIPGDLMAEYFSILNKTLHSFPQLGQPLLIGPDTTEISSKSASRYLKLFLETGGGESVDMVTFHHYYLNSRTATLAEFHEAKVLDSLKQSVIDALLICNAEAPSKQCWLGETSSSYGGGTEGISDRFVAGFLWLDKLGISALYGLKGVMRQSFYGGHYGLIDANLDPNPDYWLTVLFKRLVGRTVLNIKPSSNPNLRIYAHCSNTNSSMGYNLGDVTIYVMNLGSDSISIDITGYSTTIRHLYLLSPGDENGLTSQFVRLNGDVLKLPNDNILPLFDPRVQHGGAVQLPGYNMGFIVLPNAKLLQCI